MGEIVLKPRVELHRESQSSFEASRWKTLPWVAKMDHLRTND